MNNLMLRLPEVVIEGKRLGRHINHDPRSLSYLIAEGTPTTARWERRIPVLDQGNLGSCTGNATVGALGTSPLFEALSTAQQQRLNEQLAVAIYSAATKIDDAPGTYPPTDTGSDGLSVAKVAKADGYSSGYTHATSLAACYAAIAAGPFIVGVNWYDGFDNPNSEGIVKVSGQVRGGHEFVVIGYDAGKGLWEAVNSWGDSWGKAGHFFFADADLTRLLAEQGDATSLLPLSVPAPTPTPPQPAPTPTPTPVPTPTPGSTTVTFTAAQYEALDAWADNRWGRGAKAAREAWLAVKGL